MANLNQPIKIFGENILSSQPYAYRRSIKMKWPDGILLQPGQAGGLF